jgi:hypothetical protein
LARHKHEQLHLLGQFVIIIAMAGAEQRPGNSLLDQVEIITDREHGLVEAMIPVELICTEDVPVDADHVDELADSMAKESERAGSTGQLSPVLVGEVPGRDQFLIIDGFHRSGALKKTDTARVYATIRRDSTEEEVTDLRILTAATHRSVRFARIIEWVEEAWQRTEWSADMTALQAFSLTASQAKGVRVGGNQVNLEAEVVQAIKDWAQIKCGQWKLSAGAIHNNLHVASIADPELVKQAREGRAGGKLEAVTPKHLDAIARAFPENHEMQRFVANVATDQSLTMPQAKILLEKLASAESTEEAKERVAEPGFVESLKPSLRAIRLRPDKADGGHEEPLHSPPPSTRSSSHSKYNAVLAAFVGDEIELARLSLQSLVYEGKYVCDRLAKAPPEPDIPVDSSQMSLQGVSTSWGEESLEHAIERIEEIKDPLTNQLAQRFSLDMPVATALVDTAEKRLIKDVHTGGLRFVEVNGNSTLDALMRACIVHEYRSQEMGAPALKARRRSEEADFSYDAKLKARALIEALPKMNPKIRRMIMLRGVFKLSPFVVAQVVKSGEQRIDPAIEVALRGLNYDL